MFFGLWVPVVRLAQGQLVEDFSLLEPGDVVLARSRRTNRKTGDEFWWNRFEVVTTSYSNSNVVGAIPLKLDTTMANEHVLYRNGHKSVPADYLTFVHPDHYPDGVSAMYMKFVMKGIIKPRGG